MKSSIIKKTAPLLAAALCVLGLAFGVASATGFATNSGAESSVSLSPQALTTGQIATQDNSNSSWGLESIHASEAQEYVKSHRVDQEKPVCIAVLDTGFYANHPAIKDKVVATWNAAAAATKPNERTVNGKIQPMVKEEALEASIDVTPPENLVAASGAGESDPNHGTHVAGIVSGVAPNANIVLIRVSDDDGNIPTWAIYNAYALIIKHQEALNIRVVNFSGGSPFDAMPAHDGTTYESLVYDQIDDAYDKGIVTVCSAGNTGTTGINYPADYEKVVSVMGLAMRSATPTEVVLDSSSNRNPDSATRETATKNICAPGKNIESAIGSGTDSDPYTYGKMSGTSMAAPHVAGTLALMFSSNSDLTTTTPESSQKAIDILYSTATDLGVADWDTTYACGEVNAAVAVGASVIQGPTEILLTPGNTPIYYEYSVIGANANESWKWSKQTDQSNSGDIYVSKNDGKVYGLELGTVKLQAKYETTTGTTTLEKTITVVPLDFSQFGKTGYPITLSSPDFEFSNEMKSQTYTGSALTPRVGVRVKGYELVEGTDYEVSFSNNLNASTKARFTIKGLWSTSNQTAKFKGSWSGVFTIYPAALSASDITLSSSRVSYTGKALTPAVTVKHNGRSLTAGTDYALTFSSNTVPGNAKATVVGKGNYIGTATKAFTITKAKQPMTLKGLTKAVKYSKVKKRAQVLARPITVKNAKGTVTYAKKSGNGKISVNKSTGKVTVKKGLKKGKYKVKINVTAAGNANYSKATKLVTAVIHVK